MDRRVINNRYSTWTNLLWTGENSNIIIDRAKKEILVQNIDFVSPRTIMEVNLSSNYRNEISVKFRNCTFKHENDNYQLTISINNYEKGQFSFESCSGHSISVGYLQNIELTSCKFDTIGVSHTSSLIIKKSEFRNFSAYHSSIRSTLEISKNGIVNSISFQHCQFTGTILKGLTGNNIDFQDCSSTTKVNIIQVKARKSLKIISCTIHELAINTLSGEILELRENTFDQLNCYRTNTAIKLVYNNFRNAKISHSRKASIYLSENRVKNEFIFYKNLESAFELSSEVLDNLKFEKNQGDVIIRGPRGFGCPNFESNQLGQLTITDTNLEADWTLAFDVCRSLQFYRVKLLLLNISGNSCESLKIEAKCSISKIRICIHESQHISIKDCSLEDLSVTSKDCKTLKLLSIKTSGLNLSNSSIEELRITKSEIPQAELLNIRSKSIQIDSMVFKSFTLTESKINSFHFDDEDGVMEGTADLLKFSSSLVQRAYIHLPSLEKVVADNLQCNQLNLNISTLKKLDIQHCNITEVYIGSQTEGSCWSIHNFPTDNISFLDLETDGLHIKNPSKEIDGQGNIIISYSDIQSCTVKQYQGKLLQFEASDILSIYMEDNGTQETETSFQNTQVKNLRTTNHNGKLVITESDHESITLSKSNLGILRIEKSQNDKGIGNLLVENSQRIAKFYISDITITNLHINRLKAQEIDYSDLTIGSLKFTRLRAKDTGSEVNFNFINTDTSEAPTLLSIIDSDLTDFNFNSCYFGTFQELEVKSSKLDRINCTATTWPKKVISENSKNQQFEIREACRQLKLAMHNHQDKASELQFHSLEMNAYRKIVYTDWYKRNNLKSNWNDKLTLLFALTNNYGLNWFKPLIWIIGSITLIFHAALWAQFSCSPLKADFYDYFLWSDYFQLYNPAHRISQLSFGTNITAWASFWDFMSKIIAAFFIYQLVAAFRKFRR